MPSRDIIVIGASAGGIEALLELIPRLPPDLPAAVLVTVHLQARVPSALPDILGRRALLPTHHPAEGETIRPGQIYVAPPDRHLIVKGDRLHLTRGPRQNGFRPSIDVMFRTAARAFGPRVIGVVLSGALDDGTVGLLAIKRHNGIAVVQDPTEAAYPSMPRSALENVPVDHVARTADLGTILNDLARQTIPESAATAGGETMSDPNADSNSELGADPRSYADSIRDIAETARDGLNNGPMPGIPAQLTCPDCGGALWEVRDGELYRYICHVGHNFSPEGMVEFQNDGVELALWTALRALEESVSLRERMAQRAADRDARTAERYHQQAVDARRQAHVLRKLLLNGNSPPDPGTPAGIDVQSAPLEKS